MSHAPLCLLKNLLLASLVMPLHGAVTWPSVEHYTWNFNLGTGSPSSSTTDMFTVQFDSTDTLVEPERLLIRLYAGNANQPVYSKTMIGYSFGTNGLLLVEENWDALFPVFWGRLELEMETGSVELRRLTLSLATGIRSYSSSITPNVRLVPEPGIALMITAAGCLGLLRRRIA